MGIRITRDCDVVLEELSCENLSGLGAVARILLKVDADRTFGNVRCCLNMVRGVSRATVRVVTQTDLDGFELLLLMTAFAVA